MTRHILFTRPILLPLVVPSAVSTQDGSKLVPPVGSQFLTGADGAYLKGADGAYLLGRSL